MREDDRERYDRYFIGGLYEALRNFESLDKYKNRHLNKIGKKMNAIAGFRMCTLSDQELLEKVDKMTDEMLKNQKVPRMNVPARPNDDYDLLIGELLLRYREQVMENYLRMKAAITDRVKEE